MKMTAGAPARLPGAAAAAALWSRRRHAAVQPYNLRLQGYLSVGGPGAAGGTALGVENALDSS